MSAAQALGVTLREGVSVTGILQRAGRVGGVATTDGQFEAPVVICAANVWSPPLLRSVGLELDIRALRSQISYFHRPPLPTPTARVMLDLAIGSYSRTGRRRPRPGWRTLLGRHRGRSEQLRRRQRSRLPEYARGLVQQRIPTLAAFPTCVATPGVYDMSPDTRAIVDRAQGVEGLVLRRPDSAERLKISPIVGACLAELARDGKTSSADLRPFRYSRFAENDPIVGPDESSSARSGATNSDLLPPHLCRRRPSRSGSARTRAAPASQALAHQPVGEQPREDRLSGEDERRVDGAGKSLSGDLE